MCLGRDDRRPGEEEEGTGEEGEGVCGEKEGKARRKRTAMRRRVRVYGERRRRMRGGKGENWVKVHGSSF